MFPRCCLGLCLFATLSATMEGKEPVRHWAFLPIVRPGVPGARQTSSAINNPIDSFILAKQLARGVQGSPEAERRVLLRRVTLDLTGLPPSPREIDEFVSDPRSDAYEQVVEKLLASPAYGERWGRHWLDVARWAESEGYESNHLRPYAWRYRDFVVRSLNYDKPFSLFLRQQIAGDEMTPYSDENLIATGFLAAARMSSNEEDKWRQRNDMLVDVVNATASGFLGLTLHCAQCHNHKLEPLTARDYYHFMGFFVQGQPGLFALRDSKLSTAHEKAKPAELEPLLKRHRELFESGRTWLAAEAKKKLTPEMIRVLAIPDHERTLDQERLARQGDLLFQFTPERIERSIPEPARREYEGLKKKIAELAKGVPDRPQTFAFYSPATSPTPVESLPMKGFYPLPYEPEKLRRARAYLLTGGDVHQRKQSLEPAWPAILGPRPVNIGEQPRLALADWMARNPLTARVWANRVWHYHFGRGLVATPSDFGIKGSPPSHPELLDWLASELIGSSWSTKRLHRLIVTSGTYRQASQPNRRNERIDPDNVLLWRWLPRRLEAETIRDTMLAVSGELDHTMGDVSDEDEKMSRRRTLYLLQKRERPPAIQGQFDGPSAVTESCPVRHASTGALQALYLLNNEFTWQRAQAIAARVRQQAGEDREKQIETAFLLVLGRKPEEGDHKAARQFFAPAHGQDALLVPFCQALLNLNESVYLE